jgi:predicted MFS family arabinose efflux permease
MLPSMSTRSQLIVISLLRTILNTMHRMVYPFLSVFARGLGVDVISVSFALTGRNIVGIFGPLLAPIADVRGRRLGMLLGAGLFSLGTALVAIWPGVITFAAALILAILSKNLFDPAVLAYFGDRVSYERRGTAVAISEMAWSAAFIAGVPAMGFLIARFGWQAPFPVLAILGLGMLAVIWRLIPQDGGIATSVPVLSSMRTVLNSMPALAGVSIALWASAANEVVNLVFGVWLADSFGLQIAALAGASAVIGLAELGGEGLVATVTDRIGKPRAVAVGLAANILAAALLPWIGRTPPGALAGLFLFYISFEYLLVSQLPMMTEVVPAARATTIALNSIGFGIGRSAGALLSTVVYARLGFGAVTILAIFFNVLALLALAEMQQKLSLLPRVLAWLRRAA